MPIGFGRSILSKTIVASGAAATQGGYWASNSRSNDPDQAEHAHVDLGSGGDYYANHDGTYQIMWWVKGQTSDFNSDNNQQVFRTYKDEAGDDDGYFVEFTSTYVQAGVHAANNSFHFFKWQPSGFATNYLNDAWHHFLFEVDGTSSKLYVDGVNKTSEASDQAAGGTGPVSTIGGSARYGFVGGGTTTRPRTAYTGLRTGTFQFADVWFKNNSTGDLASNISTIYNSGWQDPTVDGTFGGVLPTPDTFIFADGSSLGSVLPSGASVGTIKGTTGGFTVSNSGGPGGN